MDELKSTEDEVSMITIVQAKADLVEDEQHLRNLLKTKKGIKDHEGKIEKSKSYWNGLIEMVIRPLREKMNDEVAISKLKKAEKLEERRVAEKRRIHDKYQLGFPVGDEETAIFPDGYLDGSIWFLIPVQVDEIRAKLANSLIDRIGFLEGLFFVKLCRSDAASVENLVVNNAHL